MINQPKNLSGQVTDCDVKAILGNTLISYEEFVNLQIDDLLILDQSIESLITLSVEGQKKFNGIPGVYDDKRAMKIGETNE